MLGQPKLPPAGPRRGKPTWGARCRAMAQASSRPVSIRCRFSTDANNRAEVPEPAVVLSAPASSSPAERQALTLSPSHPSQCCAKRDLGVVVRRAISHHPRPRRLAACEHSFELSTPRKPSLGAAGPSEDNTTKPELGGLTLISPSAPDSTRFCRKGGRLRHAAPSGRTPS